MSKLKHLYVEHAEAANVAKVRTVESECIGTTEESGRDDYASAYLLHLDGKYCEVYIHDDDASAAHPTCERNC